MPFNLDVYFNPLDLQALLNMNPVGIVIKCISVPNPKGAQEPTPVLMAIATAYDSQENAMFSIMGCPTPCKPGGGGGVAACLNQNESLLQNLKNQFQSLDLNSLL